MSSPIKELMTLTLEKQIALNGYPVLRWMMVNIYIRTDPEGNIEADKEKSTEKTPVPSPPSWPLTGQLGAVMTPTNMFEI